MTQSLMPALGSIVRLGPMRKSFLAVMLVVVALLSGCGEARLLPEGTEIGSVVVLGVESVEGAPGVEIEFLTYRSVEGNCFSMEAIVEGERHGQASGCGRPPTSLENGGLQGSRFRTDQGGVYVLAGVLQQPEVSDVHVAFASGEVVVMPIAPNGLFYVARLTPGLEVLPDPHDPDFTIVEVRAVSANDQILEIVRY